MGVSLGACRRAWILLVDRESTVRKLRPHKPPTTALSTMIYTHHGQMLVKVAAVYDALAINKQIFSQPNEKLHHDSKKGVAHAAMPGEEDA